MAEAPRRLTRTSRFLPRSCAVPPGASCPQVFVWLFLRLTSEERASPFLPQASSCTRLLTRTVVRSSVFLLGADLPLVGAGSPRARASPAWPPLFPRCWHPAAAQPVCEVSGRCTAQRPLQCVARKPAALTSWGKVLKREFLLLSCSSSFLSVL